MKCHKCGGPMSRKGYTHVSNVGGLKVTDGSGMAMTCSACGEVVLSSKELEGYELRAARVALLEGKNVTGAALKFARKALGLRQKDLAAIMRCAETNLSRLENAPEMDMGLRFAMVTLIDIARSGQRISHLGSSDEQTLDVKRSRVA